MSDAILLDHQVGTFIRRRRSWVCLSVCLWVCLSVREDISGTTCAIFTKFLCMLPLSVTRSSSNMFTIGRIVYRREGVFFPIENALSAGKGDGSAERGRSMLCTIDVDVLWPNGWTDQDATWYGGRPRPRRHCVRWGPSYPTKTGTAPSLTFRPTLLWHGRSS